MSLSFINPPALHDPTGFGYSHAVRLPAQDLVLVAGQYGSGPDGAVVSGDFAEQAAQAFSNLDAALRGVGVDIDQVVQLRTFIVDHDETKLGIIVDLVQQRWGAPPPAQTLIGVAALALPGMLFEVDAIAATTSRR